MNRLADALVWLLIVPVDRAVGCLLRLLDLVDTHYAGRLGGDD